jgi:hypothetical protein
MADARKLRVPQAAADAWKRLGPPGVADTKAVLREVAEAGTAVVGPPAADTTGRIAFPHGASNEPTDRNGGLFLFTNIYQG